MEMAMTGRLYSAAEAERFGLVNRVVPEGRALDEAQALARTVAQHSAAALAIGKRAFYARIERRLDEAYAVASLAMIDNLAEPDRSRAWARSSTSALRCGDATAAIDGAGQPNKSRKTKKTK